MGKLAALGCTPAPLMTGPEWLGPLWLAIAEDAERRREEWGRSDAIDVVETLVEAM